MGIDDDMVLVYDGLHQPTVTQFVLNNITGPLVTYKFHVTGINFNGEGSASP
jgi:hypothetical protein